MKFQKILCEKRDFELWLAPWLDQLNRNTIDIERNRLGRLLQYSLRVEEEMLAALKLHLASTQGKRQLVEEASLKVGSSLDCRVKAVEEELIHRCCQAAKERGRHDFETRMPPNFRCIVPSCRAVFTTAVQYSDHVHREGETTGDYSTLHLMLMRPQQRRDLISFLSKRHGIGRLVHLVDIWCDLDSWKRCNTGGREYISKAIAIYENYLSPGASRPVHLPTCGAYFMVLLKKLNDLKHRSQVMDFFEERVMTKRTTLQYLLRLPPQRYSAWTDANVLLPSALEQLEWDIFQALFTEFQSFRVEFDSSAEASEMQLRKTAEESRRRAEYLADYRELKRARMMAWAREFKAREIKIEQLAVLAIKAAEGGVVDVVLDAAVDGIVFDKVRKEGQLVLDAICSAEKVILDEIFALLAPALVITMLAIPAYRVNALRFVHSDSYRDTMDLVTGPAISMLQKVNVERRLSLLLRVTPIPLSDRDSNAAALLIQLMVRRRLAYKRARKAFVTVWSKRYNSGENAYYYINSRSQEAFWAPPRITSRYFPLLRW